MDGREDITEEASRLVGEIWLHPSPFAEGSPMIAAALLAAEKRGADKERDRCLKIALERTAQLPHDSDMTRGYSEGRLAVAAAIRAS